LGKGLENGGESLKRLGFLEMYPLHSLLFQSSLENLGGVGDHR
jgi:hypothetical protein